MITIATVTYNAAVTLIKTIESILNQTYENIEYVVVDGKSTDGTIDILKSYGERIKWISEPDKGIYDAMNKALDIANGEFLIFMGADDVLYSPTTIEEVVSKIVSLENIYYGKVLRFPSNKIYGPIIRNGIDFGKKNICHQSIFYPKAIYKTKKYDLKYKIYADNVYNWQLYSEKPDKFVYIDVIVSRFFEEGLSGGRDDENFKKNEYQLMSKYLGKDAATVVWIGRKIKSIMRKLKGGKL